MNRAETTELFAVLMLAYPNADVFKAPDQRQLMEKLAPTITLWAACLKDVDLWTAQQAVVKLCQTCKYPPNIAELRDAVQAVRADTRREIEDAYSEARSAFMLSDVTHKTEAEILEDLPKRTRKTIEAMGGLDAFMPPDKPCFDMAGFRHTYERLLRTNPVGLPAGAALPALTD